MASLVFLHVAVFAMMGTSEEQVLGEAQLRSSVAADAFEACDSDGFGALQLLQVDAAQKLPRRQQLQPSLAVRDDDKFERANATKSRSVAMQAQSVVETSAATAGKGERSSSDIGSEEEEEEQPVRDAPKKNKVVLMVLEMIPLAGPLGLDRFYLGATGTAVAKLTVCICTCLVGGLLWGLLDALIVIANALGRKPNISTLGMVATFGEDQIEPSFALALIAIILQVFVCCGGRRLLLVAYDRVGKKGDPAASVAAVPVAPHRL